MGLNILFILYTLNNLGFGLGALFVPRRMIPNSDLSPLGLSLFQGLGAFAVARDSGLAGAQYYGCPRAEGNYLNFCSRHAAYCGCERAGRPLGGETHIAMDIRRN